MTNMGPSGPYVYGYTVCPQCKGFAAGCGFVLLVATATLALSPSLAQKVIRLHKKSAD